MNFVSTWFALLGFYLVLVCVVVCAVTGSDQIYKNRLGHKCTFLPEMPTGSDSKKDFSLHKTEVEVRRLTEQETELSRSPQASHPKQRPAALLHNVGRKETGIRFPAWREQF